MKTASLKSWMVATLVAVSLASALRAQTLFNIDFGVGTASAKTGFAAIGRATNDFWNLYRHYDPKFAPGMALVADGRLDGLKLADGTPTPISVLVTNAPGVWGNTSGDPMFDTYLFAQNGSNITIAIHNLQPGHVRRWQRPNLPFEFLHTHGWKLPRRWVLANKKA